MKFLENMIAYSPVVLIFGAKFALDPNWMNSWNYLELIILGAMIGVFVSLTLRVMND